MSMRFVAQLLFVLVLCVLLLRAQQDAADRAAHNDPQRPWARWSSPPAPGYDGVRRRFPYADDGATTRPATGPADRGAP